MRYLAAAAMLVILAACGSRGALEPAPGASLPPAPYGARATPTPGELTTATTEQRPGRADDVLTVDASVASRKSFGGTAPDRVRAAVAAARAAREADA